MASGTSRFFSAPAAAQSISDTVKIGHRPRLELYHYLMTAPWSVVFGLLLVAYLLANVVFAFAYQIYGGIENARPGNFEDAYFFSVQTMATIGYGRMTPVSTLANVFVTLEAFGGILGVALATGLVFAKFSQPRAQVLFSKYATITTRDGVLSLIIRLANERRTGLAEAQLHIVLLRNELTIEGERVRRFHTLRLVRAQSAVFSLSWTAIHPIDEASPLHGATPESLAASSADVIASVVGLEEATAQTVHARYRWRHDEILFRHRFRDIFVQMEDGRRVLDLSRFHDVLPEA